MGSISSVRSASREVEPAGRACLPGKEAEDGDVAAEVHDESNEAGDDTGGGDGLLVVHNR